jgi:hypothetical protein
VYVFETFDSTDQAPYCRNTEFHNTSINLHHRNTLTFLYCAIFVFLNLMTGQHPFSFSVSTEAPSKVKRSVREANNSPPSTVDFKITRAYTFTPTFLFLACTQKTTRCYFTLSCWRTMRVRMYKTIYKIIIFYLLHKFKKIMCRNVWDWTLWVKFQFHTLKISV